MPLSSNQLAALVARARDKAPPVVTPTYPCQRLSHTNLPRVVPPGRLNRSVTAVPRPSRRQRSRNADRGIGAIEKQPAGSTSDRHSGPPPCTCTSTSPGHGQRSI